ncbi:hypothetical protein SDC9_111304 [bioreactor metagenome]|uniref:Uncharacterized protein n=1 Tax=bioreactor metagenome TaxID=1076179 RepID=A0A645BH36_9ZZZZ
MLTFRKYMMRMRSNDDWNGAVHFADMDILDDADVRQ